jgi:hypothetical protein
MGEFRWNSRVEGEPCHTEHRGLGGPNRIMAYLAVSRAAVQVRNSGLKFKPNMIEDSGLERLGL